MVDLSDCQEKNDNELVALSLQKPDYFFCLAKRYEEKLLRYIVAISGLPRDEAKDVLQEVLIKTYYHLNDFDQRLKFSSWLYRIAHNQTISEIRKKRSRPTVFIEETDFDHWADEFDLIAELDNHLAGQLINRVLENLGEKYREVMILRFLEEKSYIEIADILRLPVSTVGNLIARGKKQFKDEYEKMIKHQ